ncbi:unnamed protein product [Heterobilharzia americana]|nr:unnamed protein product [Heterobilharzia americana]
MYTVTKFLGEKIGTGSLGYHLSPWIAYQLARQANRYGQHEFAGRLYEKLSFLTLTEKSYFWISGLYEFSQMESKLINLARSLEIDVQRTLIQYIPELCPPSQNTKTISSSSTTTKKTNSWIGKLIIGLRNAAEEACKIQTTIMCVGGSDGRWFQAKYIQIRSLLLTNLSNLCSSVHYALKIGRWSGSIMMNQSSQNEAIDGVMSTTTSQNLVWLSSCVESWNDLSQEISKLRAQCLDADLETHRHLEAITQLVEFFTEVLNLIDGSGYSSRSFCLREYFSSGSEINSNHTYESDPYGKAVSLLKVSMIQYFPDAGSNPDDILTISSDVCHMVQVMGVVQQRSRQALLCRIKAVEIAVNVNEICPETIRNGQFTKLGSIFSTQKVAQLKGDYFHCEFCIRFPQCQVANTISSGTVVRQNDRIFCIHAHPSLIDSLGSHWDLSANAGASDESVLVRVESLPPPATLPIHASNSSEHQQHCHPNSQGTNEVIQSIPASSNSISVSAATTIDSSSHISSQKSELTKSKIASRSLDSWKSSVKNRSKKIGGNLKLS